MVAEGYALSIVADGKKILLESQGGNAFLADDYSLAALPTGFYRNSAKAIMELSHGPDWYVNGKYTGPTTFPACRVRSHRTLPLR